MSFPAEDRGGMRCLVVNGILGDGKIFHGGFNRGFELFGSASTQKHQSSPSFQVQPPFRIDVTGF